MTLPQLEQFIKDNIRQPLKAAIIISAVRKYSSASNGAKPIVSGALPQLVERLEERINESDCGLDDVSWGMQEGVLISVREAKLLVDLLRQ